MRAPRDIIKHVSIAVAKGKRRCHRTRDHTIAPGHQCLVIIDGAYKGSKNYCTACGRDILGAAERKLAALRSGLGLPFEKE